MTLNQTYGWPAALAVVIFAGLLSALFGDGAWDAISWVLLLTPLGVIVACLLRPLKKRNSTL